MSSKFASHDSMPWLLLKKIIPDLKYHREELISLASKIQHKVSILIQKRGLDDQDHGEFDKNLLSDVATISIRQKSRKK